MALSSSDRTKYNVPLAHLDHGYIKTCTDDKELEKICKILWSGCEGSYPDLEQLAEDRLKTINPDSKVLRKEKPVSTKRDFSKSEQDEMDADLSSWADEMRTQDGCLQQTEGSEIDNDRLPPVRGASTDIPINKKSAEEKERKQRRVKPRDYNEWDKVDIEAELAKIDGEKPKPVKSTSSKNMKDIPVMIETSDLTDAEKTLKAGREKDKGNEAFRAGDYEEALVYYQRSINVQPSVAAYNNRAQTYLKMEKWAEAYKDCNKVLDVEPDNLKALLRRAVSAQGSHDYIQSKNDLMTVLHTEPNNKRAQLVLEEVEKSLGEQKVKGRRMVIEEVEGSDSSEDNEDEGTTNLKINGHTTEAELKKSEQLPNHEQSTKPEISKINQANVVKGANPKKHTAKSNKKGVESNAKDIWTEDDLNQKPTYTAKIPVNKDHSKKGASEQKRKIQDMTSQCDAKADVESGTSCVNVASSVKGNMDKEAADIEKINSKTLPETKDVKMNKSLKNGDGNDDTMPRVEDDKVKVEQAPLPSDCAALKDKGNQLFKKGQYPDATEFYDKVINKLITMGPTQEYNLSLLYCNRAASRHKMGNCSGCIEDCHTALQLQPASIKALARRAMAYETTEKYRLAYVDFRQILLLDSSVEIAQQGSTRCTRHLIELDGPRWREKLPTITPIVAPSISMMQSQSNNDTNAVNVPSEKMQKSSEKPVDKEKLFEKFKSEGNNFVKKGDYKSAIDCYSKCIEYCPGSVVAYTNRALCYLKTKQPKLVVEDCSTALSVEGDNVKALFRRALAYKDTQQYDASVNDLKHLIKVDSKNVAARKEFAAILREKQEHEIRQKQSADKPRQRIQIQEVEGSDSSEDEEVQRANRNSKSKSSKSRKTAGKSNRNCPSSKHKVDTAVKTHTETFSLSEKQKEGNSKKAETESQKSSKVTAKTTENENKGKKTTTKSDATVKNDSSSKPQVQKDNVEIKKSVPVLSKATPYEFMQAWTGLKSSQNTELYAELLSQVAPKELKTVISNNLEGDMLMRLTRCVHYISDHGDPENALQYLMNFPNVPRFSMVSMFMSDQDKKDVSSVVDQLKTSLGAAFTPDQLSYVAKQYQL